MTRSVAKGIRLAVMAAGLLVVAGCATPSQRINIIYQPVANASGGRGNVVLTARDSGASSAQGTVRWVLGNITSEESGTVGEITSATAPADLVLDALRQELFRAGYTVNLAGTMPADVPQGIDLTKVTVTLKETTSILKVEANSQVAVSFGLYKKGVLVDKVTFESRNSDFAVKDRGLLLPALLQKGLQNVMKQAVPAIITSFGK